MLLWLGMADCKKKNNAKRRNEIVFKCGNRKKKGGPPKEGKLQDWKLWNDTTMRRRNANEMGMNDCTSMYAEL